MRNPNIIKMVVNMVVNSDFADERVFAAAIAAVDERDSPIREDVFKVVMSKTTEPETLVSIINETNDPSVVEMAVKAMPVSVVLAAAGERVRPWLEVLSAIAGQQKDIGDESHELPLPFIAQGGGLDELKKQLDNKKSAR